MSFIRQIIKKIIKTTNENSESTRECYYYLIVQVLKHADGYKDESKLQAW